MITLPQRIRDSCRFILVRPASKAAKEKNWETRNNYDWSDPVIQDQLNAGSNYGIIPQGGVGILDMDLLEVWKKHGVYDRFIDTYGVETGRVGGGEHRYIICTDAPAEKFLIYGPENPKEQIGDFRGSGHYSYVLGPGSVHPNGNIYQPLNGTETLKQVSFSELKELLSPLDIREEKKIELPPPGRIVGGSSITDEYDLRVETFLYPLNATIRDNGEVEGTHPIHGSEGGHNLWINPIKGVWHCFRCHDKHIGGDAAMAAAVKYGLIDCEDVGPGCITKEIGRELVKRLESDGYKKKSAIPNQPWKETKPTDENKPRPAILVPGREFAELANESVRHLLETGTYELFNRGGWIVEVAISDEENVPVIRSTQTESLSYHLSTAARFYKLVEKREKDESGERITTTKDVSVYPPPRISSAILNTGAIIKKFPNLVGITGVPIITSSGIRTTPGYDPETNYYYAPVGLDIPPVKDNPTPEDVQKAVDDIKEVFCDVQFNDGASGANMFAAFITPVIRPLIDGCVPICVIDKPQQGTGGSLMVNVTSIVTTGQEQKAQTPPTTEEEWNKQLLTSLRGGKPIISFDNVKNTLDSPSLAATVTARSREGRKLGTMDQLDLPNRSMVFLNGNNIRISGDIPRRCFWVRLIPNHPRPWESEYQYTHPGLKAWVRETRGNLVNAILTLVWAWIRAGKPIPKKRPVLGGFEEWVDTLSGILTYAGISGFLENLEEMYDETDTDIPMWGGFFEAWAGVYGEEPVTINQVVKSLENAVDDDSADPVIHAQHVFRQSLPPQAHKNLVEKKLNVYLGYKLRAYRDRTFPGGWQVRKEPKDNKSRVSAKWFVRNVSGHQSVRGIGDHRGNRGFSLPAVLIHENDKKIYYNKGVGISPKSPTSPTPDAQIIGDIGDGSGREEEERKFCELWKISYIPDPTDFERIVGVKIGHCMMAGCNHPKMWENSKGNFLCDQHYNYLKKKFPPTKEPPQE